MGGVVDNLLSPEELRELNRLAERVRRGARMSNEERERYEELLREGGAVLARDGVDTGEQHYGIPIMIGFNELSFLLHVMEQNGVYDALLSEINSNNPNFMESRQIVEQIYETLEAME